MSSRKARLERQQRSSTDKAMPTTHRARKQVARRKGIPSALAIGVLLLAIIGVTTLTVTFRTSSSAAQNIASSAAPPQPIAKSAQVLVYMPDMQPAWQTKTLATVANDSEFQYEGRLYHIDAAGVMRRREYVDVNVLADTDRVYDPANWRFPESGDVVRFVDSAGRHRFHQIMDRFAADDRFWFEGVLYAVFADAQSPSGLAYQPTGRVLDVDGQAVSTAAYVARYGGGDAIAQAQDPTQPDYNPVAVAVVASGAPEQLGLLPRLKTSQAVAGAAPPAAPPAAPVIAAAPAAGSGLPTDYLFTGQKWDSATGLYKMGDRYYDPTLGRFISPDSFIPDPGNPQDLNRYSYAGNNPLKYTDPTGHCMELGVSPIPCFWVAQKVAERGPSIWQQIQALAVQYGPTLTQFATQAQHPIANQLARMSNSGTSPGGLDPKDFKGIGEKFAEKFKGTSGVDAVLKDLEMGGNRAQGASWQARYAMENLDPSDVMGFEQAGTTGRIDVVLRQGSRMTFLETKSINWGALERLNRTGEKAESIVQQMLGHAEGQKAFSKIVIESTGGMPGWVIQLLEQEGIRVEVFTR